MKLKSQMTLITAVVVVLVSLAAFFGGMKYQQSKKPAQVAQFGARQGGGANRNGTNQGNRPVSGQITEASDKSITVKLQDGSSKIIILSDSTTINKADTAVKSDLTTGQTVAVFGQTNQDGSVTAKSIQLNPMIRFGRNGDNQPSPNTK